MTETPDPTELSLPSERGPIRCAYHPVPDAAAGDDANARTAVIMVGGGDGGLDGPAEALYPDLSADLAGAGIAALRVDFRIHQFPGDVEQAVHDVLAGLSFLAGEGVARAGLLGHSFGGAVVIEAAVRAPAAASVATLATQTAGAQRVGELSPRPLLLVHGLRDIRLTPDCSRMLHEMAGEPKRLELLEEATHSLRQRREDVRRIVLDWFVDTLGASTPGPSR
jgi:dienelactone hydrolase